MVFQTNLSFNAEVWTNESFQQLKQQRQLSKTVNRLLKEHLAIEASELAQDRLLIENRLEALAVEKTRLVAQKEALEKAEQEEAERYVRL